MNALLTAIQYAAYLLCPITFVAELCDDSDDDLGDE